MSDLMANSIFEDSLFGDFTGSFEENLFSTEDWSPDNIAALNKSLEMALVALGRLPM